MISPSNSSLTSESTRFTMTSKLERPVVKIGSIPSVINLLHSLGFRRGPREEEFLKRAIEWRKSYQLVQGQHTKELLNWKTASTQQLLTEMTKDFLTDNNNGEQFWSPNRTWIQDSDLKFPEDRSKYEVAAQDVSRAARC